MRYYTAIYKVVKFQGAEFCKTLTYRAIKEKKTLDCFCCFVITALRSEAKFPHC